MVMHKGKENRMELPREGQWSAAETKPLHPWQWRPTAIRNFLACYMTNYFAVCRNHLTWRLFCIKICHALQRADGVKSSEVQQSTNENRDLAHVAR